MVRAVDGLSDPFQQGQSVILHPGVMTVESGGCGLAALGGQAGSDQGGKQMCVGRPV